MNKRQVIKMLKDMPNHSHRVILYYRLSLLFFWFSMMALFVVLFLMFRPYKVITFNEPVKVLTPTIRAGDPVALEINYCKYIDLPAHVTNRIVDEFVTTLPEMAVNNPMGCHVTRIQIDTPDYLNPGPHHITSKIIYRVNVLREIEIDWKSENFTVVK